MNRWLAAIVILLLTLNLAGTGYLAIQLVHATPATDAITDPELAQLDKLFQLVKDFRAELEAVSERATFPTDKDKKSAYQFLQNHRFAFDMARLQLKRVHEERTQAAALRFLAICWGSDDFLSNNIALTDVPAGSFGNYNEATKAIDPYPNVSLTRLESINDEFRVVALSLLKDLQ